MFESVASSFLNVDVTTFHRLVIIMYAVDLSLLQVRVMTIVLMCMKTLVDAFAVIKLHVCVMMVVHECGVIKVHAYTMIRILAKDHHIMNMYKVS